MALTKNDWENVKYLHLSTNPFGKDGSESLISQKWPSLKRIKMKRTQELEEETKEHLRSRFFPNAELIIS